MNAIIFFALMTVINVTLSTIRSLCTIKGGKWLSATTNAICYGFYPLIVMLTAKGTVYSVSLQNGHSAIEAEGVIKLFIEKKKNSDAKIERLICMWHDGSIDLPSYAFREALVSAEVSNLSAKMLLSGLNGYVVKTIKASMPEGYEKKFFYS